jgi:hypothetical protein
VTTARIQSVSFVLFLLALPLASFGAVQDEVALWGAALVLFVVAGLLPPATRFLDLDDDAADEDEAEDAEDAEDEDEARRDRRPQQVAAPVDVPSHPGGVAPPPRTGPRLPDGGRAREQRRRADRPEPRDGGEST